MKQVLIRRGQAIVDDVPAPGAEPDTILVSVRRSCISAGTELSGLKNSGLALWQLAMKYPEHLRKVVETTATLGVSRTWDLVQGRLTAGTPIGYSAAGVVVEVGAGIPDIHPGDRVACAGAQCAHHAEVIRVPRNLAVPVPDGVSLDDASTVTLGAIALQGVRRAQPTLGETFAVIGLGILGQLTVQLLRANGCRVVGMDLDRSRIELARSLGMEAAVQPEDGPAVDRAIRLSSGAGVDGAIVTAATPSNEVVSTAFRMCRKKGRVVVVGDVGLDLKRADLYAKELDFLISCSYGPGRYDDAYEGKGLDYPIAYVRWTENRNMAEYLRLVASGHVKVAPLVSATRPIEEAPEAYATLSADGSRSLIVLLSYPETAPGSHPARTVANPRAIAPRSGALRIALVGAGGFAKGMHLPNLQRLPNEFSLRAVVSRSGHNAKSTAAAWGAQYATTDFDRVLADPDVDAVIVATRHDLHAAMTVKALDAGKHVLVEKPLALTEDELALIESCYSANPDADRPVLLTGFNRRFSPHIEAVAKWTHDRTAPMIINYRMNAGYLPADHWTHGPEGGGRNLGEACHIYDLFTFLTGTRATNVTAHPIRPNGGQYGPFDNFVATMTFEDGSVASLTYTALGSKQYPKERMDVFTDGRVIMMDDFKHTSIVGAKAPSVKTKLPEKGQLQELLAFRRGTAERNWPSPLWQQVQAMRIALDVQQHLERQR